MRGAAEANRLIMLRRWLTFAVALALVTVASLVLGTTIPAAAHTRSHVAFIYDRAPDLELTRALAQSAGGLPTARHGQRSAEGGVTAARGIGGAVTTPRSTGYLCDPPRSFVAPNSTRFFAGNGPLDEGVAATFRSGTYDEVVLSQDTLLYRVYGGEAGPIGGYWSRTPPTGPMQAQLDLALNPEWGNLATDVATIRVPAGTTIYEGAAAAQSLPGGGTLLGGGNQVFIPNVNSGWLVGG